MQTIVRKIRIIRSVLDKAYSYWSITATTGGKAQEQDLTFRS